MGYAHPPASLPRTTTLRYDAVFEDCWLALLGWQAAALKCKARDQWIGWVPVTQYILTIAIAALLAGAKSYIAIIEFAAGLSQNQLKRLRARFDRKTRRFVAPSEPDN